MSFDHNLLPSLFLPSSQAPVLRLVDHLPKQLFSCEMVNIGDFELCLQFWYHIMQGRVFTLSKT